MNANDWKDLVASLESAGVVFPTAEEIEAEERERHLAWTRRLEAAIREDEILKAAYVPKGAEFKVTSVNGLSGLQLEFEPHNESEYERLAERIKHFLKPGLDFQIWSLEEEHNFESRFDGDVYTFTIEYGHRVVPALEKMEN